MSKDFHDFKQLYDLEPYRKTAEVDVIYVEELSKKDPQSGARFKVLTSETVFYPEGGGQPGDTGVFVDLKNNKTYEVLDTRYDFKASDTEEENPLIFHFLAEEISSDIPIRQEIDWERRFTHSQQHSTEHILAGLVHNKYGYMNVGFHLGREYTTIDFDGPLSYQEMQGIVDQANKIVWQNNPIDINVYTAEEAKDMEYRAKIELNNLVRLIDIPNVDVCACCGTHVKATGDIGLIICTNVEKYRNGVRITFLAGTRAYQYVREQQEISNALVQKLNQPYQKLETGVQQLENKVEELENIIINTTDSLWKKALNSTGNTGIIYIKEDIFSAKVLRNLFKTIEAPEDKSIVAFSEQKGNLTFFLFEPKERFNSDESIFKLLKEEFSARGGGSNNLAQGQIPVQNSGVSLEDIVQKVADVLDTELITI